MADWDDFFQSGPRTDDQQPLERLQDNDRIPDLRKYKMGDLREWVRAANPFPTILPKGVIRAGSQIARRIIGPQHIAWDQMPPQALCAWQNGTTVESALYGWVVPWDAAFSTTMAGMRNIARPLPERDGYQREYRLYARFAHGNAVGETGWRVVLGIDTVAIDQFSTTVTTHAVDYATGWVASSVIEGWASSSPAPIVPTGGTDYLGAAATVTCRAALLEGRYAAA